jgi:translation initiation factor 5B
VFAEFTPISKFTFLKGYSFRNNNPAVFGIRVDVGELRHKVPIMNKEGKSIGRVHQLQHEGKTVTTAKTGQEVACSIQDVTIGRQIFEEADKFLKKMFFTLFLHHMRQNNFSENLHTN